MVSVDTNVLVRLLTRDDVAQAKKATALFNKEDILITKTVILETEWVLRYAYQFNVSDIAKAFKILLGLENVTVEDQQRIAQSISLLNNGMDFADALHLSCSQNHPFATFDKKLKQKAQQAGIDNIRLL